MSTIQTHKCQAVRNLVQWRRYNMDDAVFCLDSGHRQQKFLLSSAFRSAAERYRLLLTKYTHSATSPARADPHVSRYVHWGQHYFYRLFGRTAKTAPYLINSKLITSCNEWFCQLHICTYSTGTRHITATILNSVFQKHEKKKKAVSPDPQYCTSYQSTNSKKHILICFIFRASFRSNNI